LRARACNHSIRSPAQTNANLSRLFLPRESRSRIFGPPAAVAINRVHNEIFGSGPSETPGVAAGPRRPPHLPDGPDGAGPLVSFARSSFSVRWGSAFRSLLDLAEACDVPVRWSCRTGVCHTCETGPIVGAVSYQPDPVEPPADGTALICCSQPRGDIVIDL